MLFFRMSKFSGNSADPDSDACCSRKNKLAGMIQAVLIAAVSALIILPPHAAAGEGEDGEYQSPGEIEWFSRVRQRLRSHPSMEYVEDDPDLPRVLLMGDSISMGYTLPVREMLQGKANIHRIPANGGETQRGLNNLTRWLGGEPWDVIHFNFGIHDLKHIINGRWDIEGDPVSSPEIYERNLRELVERLQATGASLIWASTTPIPEGAPGVHAGREVELNRIAARIMQENDIPVNDLYAHMSRRLEDFQRPRNVHFHEDGSRYLAEAVAAEVLEVLKYD